MNRGEVRGKEVVWLDLGEDVPLGSHTHIHAHTHGTFGWPLTAQLRAAA